MAMKRLTTSAPKDNVETALNLFYIKDHETWVRGGGPAPDYPDVSLFSFTRALIRTQLPEVEVPENDHDFSAMMSEWLFDDADTKEGIIATLYTAAWAFAELRERLMRYEDAASEMEIDAERLWELVQADREGRLKIVNRAPEGARCGNCVDFVREDGSARGSCRTQHQTPIARRHLMRKVAQSTRACPAFRPLEGGDGHE